MACCALDLRSSVVQAVLSLLSALEPLKTTELSQDAAKIKLSRACIHCLRELENRALGTVQKCGAELKWHGRSIVSGQLFA